MGSPLALHSHKTPKWGTPPEIIELCRELMGYITLDPASSEEFNTYVKALLIYTEQSNGLAPNHPWVGNIFLNPPGGQVKAFWNKLTESYMSSQVDQAVWIGFSVEQLCTLADEYWHPADFSICYLRNRLKFNKQDGQLIAQGSNPSHANYICALGVDHARFHELFSPIGKVVRGVKALDLSPTVL